MAVEIIRAMFATLFVAVSALGYGGLLANPLKRSNVLSDLERLTLRLLAGFGILALILFIIGQVSFKTPVILLLLFIGVALLVLQFLRLKLSPALRGGWFGAVSLLFVACLAVCSMAVPAGPIGDDAIAYHLAGPPVWIRHGLIRPLLDNSHTAFPAIVETLFAAAISLSNLRAAGAVSICFALILLLQTYALARRFGAPHATAGLAMLLVTAIPVISNFWPLAFVDTAFACFVLAFVRLALEVNHSRDALLAGIFAGFAAGVKYTALPLTCLSALFVFAFSADRPAARLRYTLTFVGAAFAIGAAWYLRNWILLGSPIYPPPPGLAAHFTTPSFPLESSQRFQDYILDRGKGLGRDPLHLLLLPFTFTFFTAYFHGGGGIGLAPLALGPIGLGLLWKTKPGMVWALWALGATLCWFWTQQETRFAYHLIVISVVFAAIGVDALWHGSGRAGRLLVFAILGVSIIYGTMIVAGNNASAFLSLFSPRHAELRRWRLEPWHDAFDWLNAQPDVKRVLILNPNVPTVFLNKEYLCARGRWGERALPGIQNNDEALAHLDAFGVTHILDVREEGGDFQLRKNPFEPPVFAGNDFRIYTVAAP